MSSLKIDTGGGNVLDCVQVVEDVVMKHGDEIDAMCWQRLRARLTPDRERVARSLAAHYGWTGWDTARDCRDTPSGDDPEDEREYWRGMADAAINAMGEP
ncbi:hypothetical protein [Pseudomonas sp.]|uniref:hypothetical protein n=1 Tax=Pseudomonas sp. TaxID=306 RepID=UPI0033409A3E